MLKKNVEPIGVFDSGVGGLSVLIELKKKLPNENFVFLADQKYVPYGEKTKEELVKLVYKITNYLIKYHNIKMLVVACNTATCGAIDELRAKYKFPIVGTVPAVKLAAKQTETGTIACIATPSTSKSDKLNDIIKNDCSHVKVLNIGCQFLENAVETGDLNSAEVKYLLQKYLKEVKESPADQLVLGCTHYPFLKKPIRKILGSKIKLIDSGKAIARRTESLLETHNIKNEQKRAGKSIYFTTSDAPKFSKVTSKLIQERVKAKMVRI